MTLTDATSPARAAQRLVVEYKVAYGSPPSYSRSWSVLWDSEVDKIELTAGSRPSAAVVWFPQLRWNQDSKRLRRGNLLRIRTAEPLEHQRSILFEGFVTSKPMSYTGGTESSSAHERVAVTAADFRWLLAATSLVVGQLARSPDDYIQYGTSYEYPKDNSYTWLSGRRAIFNADGLPNKDPQPLVLTNPSIQMPIFCDPDIGLPWTARDMLTYLLSPVINKAYNYLPLDPTALPGLEHSDFDRVLNHIVVDGLNIMEAVELVCTHIGWSFRQDYTGGDDVAGDVTLVFYKLGAASGYVRADEGGTILHSLHCPDVGDSLADAVAEGRKLLWSMALQESIAGVINNPWGIGAPHRFEFTAELVPAWLDSELVPDTSEDLANLFFTEADLQDITNPNSKSYYRYYHPRGSQFLRNVGRQWALNESGRYSGSSNYDRGMPYDFSEVIDSQYILDKNGKRKFAPFRRRLLPCLTVDKDSLNSVGILVEFSFDGGSTWQVLPASVSSLPDECGIYIEEANLAEMVDRAESDIADEGGPLDGIQLNYFTSLCDDALNGRSFKNSQWRTRVRVTASVQMDIRLAFSVPNISGYGSPFEQNCLYDFSERYGLVKRQPASVFTGVLPARSQDSTSVIVEHLKAIREANQDASVSGIFVLERLWLGDGSGRADFAVGDGIEKITGRSYKLYAASDAGYVYPEIVQITYLPAEQRMELITRDLRFAQQVEIDKGA